MEIRQGYKQTEVGIIPEEWEVKKLGECFEVIMGQSPSSKSYNEEEEGLPLVQGNADIKNNKVYPRMYTSEITKESYPNDLIMTVRAPVGDVYISDIHSCIGRGICAIRNGNKYLYYYLFNYKDKWERLAQGSTFTAITVKEVKDLNIPIPPLKEQEKIAEILSNYDKAIEQQELLLEKEKEFKKGMMQKIFSQKIRFKDDNGEDYPEWHLVYTKDISKITMGFTPSTKDEEMWNGQYKWLSITDLKENGKYIYKTSKTISEKGIKNKRILLKGTLVMSFKLTLGRVGILADNMFTNEAICHFHWLDKDKISTEYIYYYLSNIDITNFGKQAVKGVTLNTESLNSIEIQLPCFEEQEKIANFLSDIDSKIELLENKLELLKNEKKGMMQKLLTGEVRV